MIINITVPFTAVIGLGQNSSDFDGLNQIRALKCSN